MMAVAALTAVLLLATGCAVRSGGSPGPASSSSSAPTSTTPNGPAIVPAAAIKSMLVKRSELAAIVGDTDLTEVTSFTEPNEATTSFEPFAFAVRALVGASTGYYAPTMQALVRDGNRSARGQSADS